MISFTTSRLSGLLSSFANKRIAVVGDLMVDQYYWGSVRRISPEAPVPVVEVNSVSNRLGGAANVANNIQALGGVPLLVGLVGNDHPAQVLQSLMRDQELSTDGVIVDASRPTTTKTRVIAHDQHVVRVDNESRVDCPEHLVPAVVDAVKYHIHSIDAIIIEDYNKGLVTHGVIRELTSVARKYGKIITVDPKLTNFLEFKNVTVFKPNRPETEQALKSRLQTTDDVVGAGKKLLELLSAENVLLTRGEEGMSLFESNGETSHIPTQAVRVADVSGAGDTVIATLTIALAAGASVKEAAVLANCAAGVVVGSVGIVPIRPEDLRAATNGFVGDEGR
jgi:D-glycero-beta-D-manno-heptose-7-phosphate kinase